MTSKQRYDTISISNEREVFIMTHNNYYGEEIRWEGTNTRGDITWIYGADTLEELYNKLVEAHIIRNST